jgi:hypothetical protein
MAENVSHGDAAHASHARLHGAAVLPEDVESGVRGVVAGAVVVGVPPQQDVDFSPVP